MEINRLIAMLGSGNAPVEVGLPVYDRDNYHVGDLKYYEGDNSGFGLYINGYYAAGYLPLHVNTSIPISGYYVSSNGNIGLDIENSIINLIAGLLSNYTQYVFYKQ